MLPSLKDHALLTVDDTYTLCKMSAFISIDFRWDDIIRCWIELWVACITEGLSFPSKAQKPSTFDTSMSANQLDCFFCLIVTTWSTWKVQHVLRTCDSTVTTVSDSPTRQKLFDFFAAGDPSTPSTPPTSRSHPKKEILSVSRDSETLVMKGW